MRTQKQEWKRDSYLKNKIKYEKKHLKKKYGLTPEKLLEMRLAQNDLCAICNCPEIATDHVTKETRRLSVDHDHLRGHVRGLLCMNCNQGLGKFKDNVEFLKSAIMYLSNRGGELL